MTTGTEALVRHAYHFADGDVPDAQGFTSLFVEDGVFNGIGGVPGQESYRVSNWAMWSSSWAGSSPAFTGTYTGSACSGTSPRSGCRSGAPSPGPFETPVGVIQPTGAKPRIPTAGFWYARDGKIQEFKCHIGITSMFAQLGVLPDFTSAVAASAPAPAPAPAR